MIIDMKAKYGKHLHLGVQTSPDKVFDNMVWLSQAWAPKKAKSFTICFLGHCTTQNEPSSTATGWATIEVRYFTTAKEGMTRCKEVSSH